MEAITAYKPEEEPVRNLFSKNINRPKKKVNEYNFASLLDRVTDVNEDKILLFMNTHKMESQSAIRTAMKLVEDKIVIYIDYDESNHEYLDAFVHPNLIVIKANEKCSVESVLGYYQKYTVRGMRRQVCVVNAPYDKSLLSLGLFGKIVIEFTQNRYILNKFAGDMIEAAEVNEIYYLVAYHEDELLSVRDIETMLQQKVYSMNNTRVLEYRTRKGKRLIKVDEEG